MNQKQCLLSVLALVLSALLSPPSLAKTAEEKGFEIAARSDRSDRGFTSSSADLTMLLRNAAGEESKRSLRIETFEIADEQIGDKSLVLFLTPKDIEGTALLSHAKILEPDDQWLYLPALKRIKRISSTNKSGPFVGSEFAFEDFTAIELNKFDYKFLRDEVCGALQCNVVERFPRYQNSGYTKQISWVDTSDYQVRKIEFYDRRGDLLKVLELNEYRKYNDHYWRPHHLSMANKQTRKNTELIYSNYKFSMDLTDKDFVKSRLSRLR